MSYSMDKKVNSMFMFTALMEHFVIRKVFMYLQFPVINAL
jgi:hypothetical protein